MTDVSGTRGDCLFLVTPVIVSIYRSSHCLGSFECSIWFGNDRRAHFGRMVDKVL